MNNNIKVTKYKNDTLSVQYNTFNKFKINENESVNIKSNIKTKTRTPNIKPKRDFESEFMTTKQYKRTLRRKRRELEQLDFNSTNSIFLTLTTYKPFTWVELNTKVNSFFRSLRRNFADIHYIRTFESFESDSYFHIHIILIFKDSIPFKFNKQWVLKHWTSGIFRYENVYNIYGLYDYFTTFKVGNINPKHPNYTKYPKCVQIITFSQSIPKLDKNILETNKTDLDAIKESYRNEFVKKYNRMPQCSITGHKYIDYNTGEIKYCLDREYWH